MGLSCFSVLQNIYVTFYRFLLLQFVIVQDVIVLKDLNRVNDASLFNEISRTIPLRLKDYEKQEKKLKELKASGSSKKKAESKQKEALTR